MVDIRELRPGAISDAELAAVHEVLATVHAEANTVEPYRSTADTIAFLRHPPESETRSQWVAREAGVTVGFAQLGVLVSAAGGWVIELAVHPGHRRRGIGRGLLAAVCMQARLAGCRTVTGRHTTAGGAAFARAVGATDGSCDVRSLLRLAEFTPPPIAIAGYSLASWCGAAPDSLVDSFAQARMAINDAPPATHDEWEAWDVHRVRDLERAVARRGREIRVTVALDPDRQVVGFTELRVSAEPGSVAATEDTAVLRAHRGKGLAGWMKAGCLAELQRDRPDVELVSTSNAEANAAMLAVNRRLGFVPVATARRCVLDLEGACWAAD